MITRVQGGVVSIVIAEGRSNYTGSRRNDVESGTYENYPDSYTLDGTASGLLRIHGFRHDAEDDLLRTEGTHCFLSPPSSPVTAKSLKR